MKQFVITLFFIGCALAGPPSPECMKGPEVDKTMNDCCKIPELVPQDIFTKCEAANPRLSGPPPPPPGPPGAGGPPGHGGLHHPKGCCISECVFNETGILVGGKIDKAAAIKYLSARMAGDAESIKAITTAVEFCDKDAESMKAEFDEMMTKMPAPPGEKQCNMITGYMVGCLTGQVLKNCPKDKLVAEADCGKLTEFVGKCTVLFPMKPPRA